MTVLIDTNILLDVIQNRAPHAAHAARIWQLVETRVTDGFISAISFNNVFYIVRKQGQQALAVRAMQDLRRVFGLVPLDERCVDRAISLNMSDFEDAIQLAAAEACRADYIVTRNVNDFAGRVVPAVTADELLALLPP